MPNDVPKAAKYPLLETILAYKGLPMKGTFTVQDVADLFNVTIRTIQIRMKRGGLTARDLPGRSRFLAMDLEQLLQGSSGPTSEAA
jgi:hypothetical protein